MDSIDLIKIVAAVAALAVAIIGHEIMHGYIAHLYGDNTAKNAGRLSINPLLHIDMVGTVIVPFMMYFLPILLGGESGLLFGWAKPVPINMRTVTTNGGYNAAMQVDLAGVVYNFTLAAFASIGVMAFAQPTSADSLAYIFFYIFIFQLLIINVVLGVFNLLPIPGFDGAHFVANLARKLGNFTVAEFFYRYERYGIVIVLVVLLTPLKDYVLIMPVQFILSQLLS
ncbi:MAG: site-2 protease family protein [Epsilonproteobacteria bacterium]|nr:site-2 protease family protein [Campylobacterota bacterium]